MKHALACSLLLAVALDCPVVPAAQEKPHTVGKDGLKIAGALAATDARVQVTVNPDLKRRESFPARVYSVQLAGGGRYRIDLESDEIDPFLVVQDSDGKQLAFDDDGGGALNARLQFTAPRDGVYKIFAASVRGTGDFTLTIRVDGTDRSLEVGKGLRLAGQLTAATKSVVYRVRLVQGKTYTIDMRSPDQKALDPLLRLLDASGKKLEEDDDSGGEPNARITFRADTTAVYQVVATSYQGVGRGDFTVEVREKK